MITRRRPIINSLHGGLCRTICAFFCSVKDQIWDWIQSQMLSVSSLKLQNPLSYHQKRTHGFANDRFFRCEFSSFFQNDNQKSTNSRVSCQSQDNPFKILLNASIDSIWHPAVVVPLHTHTHTHRSVNVYSVVSGIERRRRKKKIDGRRVLSWMSLLCRRKRANPHVEWWERRTRPETHTHEYITEPFKTTDERQKQQINVCAQKRTSTWSWFWSSPSPV